MHKFCILYIITLGLFMSGSSYGKEHATISYSDERLAGQPILLRTYPEYPTSFSREISYTKADSQGSFSLRPSLDFPSSNTPVFILSIGLYDMLVFLSPGDSIVLDTSPLEASKLTASRLPYIKKKLIIAPLARSSKATLHENISALEHDFTFYSEQVLINLNNKFAHQVVSQSIQELESKYSNPRNPTYFAEYLRCKIAQLELFIPGSRHTVITNYLSRNFKYRITNPAFLELMDAMWSTYLYELSAHDQGIFYQLLNKQNTAALIKLFGQLERIDRYYNWVDDAVLFALYGKKDELPSRQDLTATISKIPDLAHHRYKSRVDVVANDLKLMAPGAPFPRISLSPSCGDCYRPKANVWTVYYISDPSIPSASSDIKSLERIVGHFNGRVRANIIYLVSQEDTPPSSQVASKGIKVFYLNNTSLLEARYRLQVEDLPQTILYAPNQRLETSSILAPSSGLETYLKTFITP